MKMKLDEELIKSETFFLFFVTHWRCSVNFNYCPIWPIKPSISADVDNSHFNLDFFCSSFFRWIHPILQKLALQSPHHSASIQMSRILIETVKRPKQMEWEAVEQFVEPAHITIKTLHTHDDEKFVDLLFLRLPKLAELEARSSEK